MNIGDKVRYKGDDPRLSRGAIGRITNVDWLNDTVHVKFDTTSVICGADEFKKYMEIIIDTKILCPIVLLDWWKQTEKYMKKHDD